MDCRAGDAMVDALNGLAAVFLLLIMYTPAPTTMTTIMAPIMIHIGDMWSEWSPSPEPAS
jgi:hypothetical protein